MQRLPRVGMRMVKSAVAVFLCFVIYLIRGDGMPFYSAIAAILCMQQYVSSAIKVAWNRTVGTLIGGLFGMVVLLIEQRFFPSDLPLIRYLLISAMLIPIIYVTVVIKKTAASYITCVVFMSIAVSHATDVNPYLFAVNRMLDTLIGIFVSLGVNSVHIPHWKDKRLLFVTMLEGTLASSTGAVENETKVKVHTLKHEGARIVAASYQTPAQCAALLDELRLPVIAMGGAALYDRERKQYLKYNEILPQEVIQIKKLTMRAGTMAFFYALAYEKVQVYHMEFVNDAQRAFYESIRRIQTCVYGDVPPGAQVVQVLVIAEEGTVRELEKEADKMEGICLSCCPHEKNRDMWELVIRRKDSGFLEMARFLEPNPAHIVQVGLKDTLDSRQAVKAIARRFHTRQKEV